MNSTAVAPEAVETLNGTCWPEAITAGCWSAVSTLGVATSSPWPSDSRADSSSSMRPESREVKPMEKRVASVDSTPMSTIRSLFCSSSNSSNSPRLPSSSRSMLA